MPEVVLTIGGSDSGGGAGIQADIKTFSVLGLHGTSAITAITAQNTFGVQKVFGLMPEAVSAQLKSITDDYCLAFAKTGMLFSADIVIAVAEHLRENGIPFVLDPVIEAEAGGRLLMPEAMIALKEQLLPLASVVTPNIFEAQALAGVLINDNDSARSAANKIKDLGAKAVIVKGGHLDCTDILLEDGSVHFLIGRRVKGGNHGVGCTYSAALTSFLAQGWSLREAAVEAKEFASQAIARSVNVGKGVDPVNQIALLHEEAHRFRVLRDIERAAHLLLDEHELTKLIPEQGSSLGMAIAGAISLQDVASVEGGLSRVGKEMRQNGCVKFGAREHISHIILAVMRFEPKAKAFMSLSTKALEACESFGLEVARFDSEKANEMTRDALGDVKRTLPYVIWDEGDQSKKPLLMLLGTSATNVAITAVNLAKHLGTASYKLKAEGSTKNCSSWSVDYGKRKA